MRLSDDPSSTSSRMQRAFRTNKIEQSRLSGRLYLLEKQKVHQMRLTNQDIRMMSGSLDYIQASSGKSPEGVPPEIPKSDTEESSSSSSEEEESGPCFMYGERIVSRRNKRFRAQSAFDKGRISNRTSVSSGMSDSMTSLPDRPQSSPALRHPVFTFGEDSDKHSESGSERTDVVSIAPPGIGQTIASPGRGHVFAVGRGQVKYDWEYDVSEVTKKILKAQAEKRKDPRRALPSSIRRRGAFNDMSLNSVSSLPAPTRPGSSLDLHPGNRASVPSTLERNAQLSQILNQRRPSMSASQRSDTLSRTHTAPTMSMTSAREQMQQGRTRVSQSARVKIKHHRVRGSIEA